MKAFIEFGHETSYTKSSSLAEIKTSLKLVPYGPCFHLIDLFCYKALTVKIEKTCKNFFIAEFEKAEKIRKIAVYRFLISLLVPELKRFEDE